MGKGVIVQIAVLEALGFAPPNTVHALAALHGFLPAALGFGLTGADTADRITPMVKWVCDNCLPGATAFATAEQTVSRVKIFVLADLCHTVSPSCTL